MQGQMSHHLSRMQVLKSREPMLRAMARFALRDGTFTTPIASRHTRLTTSTPGIPSLWAGLSASILRQATYSSARFGLYNILADSTKQWTKTDKLSMPWTITCAGVAGGLAGLVGNPTEVRAVKQIRPFGIVLTACRSFWSGCAQTERSRSLIGLRTRMVC
jgi:dicarboxylate transporter 10